MSNPYNKPDNCPIRDPIYGCDKVCNYFEDCLINKMMKIDVKKYKQISVQDINAWTHSELKAALGYPLRK